MLVFNVWLLRIVTYDKLLPDIKSVRQTANTATTRVHESNDAKLLYIGGLNVFAINC